MGPTTINSWEQELFEGVGIIMTPRNPKDILEPLKVYGIGKEIIGISAGYHHSAAITVDGELYMWGKNSNGQLGLGKKAAKLITIPTKVECLTGVTITMTALGCEHSIAITDQGDALSWGAGGSGRLGHGHEPSIWGFLRSTSEYTPRLIKKLEGVKVKSIAAGMLHSACIGENGSVFILGEKAVDKLVLGQEKSATTPFMISNLPRSEEVACGGYHTCVVTKGNIYTWGWGGSHGTFSEDGHSSGGQLGQGSDVDYIKPVRVHLGKNVKALQISCGFNHTGAILECP